MSEVGLGIGREQGTYQGRTREWLYWYYEKGNRHSTQEEQMQALLTKLQTRGIDPNTLDISGN